LFKLVKINRYSVAIDAACILLKLIKDRRRNWMREEAETSALAAITIKKNGSQFITLYPATNQECDVLTCHAKI